MERQPAEWEQGAYGYGRRFANILGQYSIQRTVTFGISSALDEDNRYFNSGASGIWRRTGYEVLSGILARDSDGGRHVSISQVGRVAGRFSIPILATASSQDSPADGAVSFALSMASNMGFGVVKEFLPDIGRLVMRKRKRHSGSSVDSTSLVSGSGGTTE